MSDLISISQRVFSKHPRRSSVGMVSNCILNLSSNDYLGLATNPQVIDAIKHGIDEYGVGSGGSRLLGGDYEIFLQAENNLATFFNYAEALIFGSGFVANCGLLSLASNNDTVIFDKLSHASIINGVMASGANWASFSHNNMQSLESELKRAKGKNIFVVTESLFSMDGDIAPLKDISDLANLYGAILIVDESHAVGVFGDGKGLCSALLNASQMPDFITFSLGKAFGLCGGVVLCKQFHKDMLQTVAREFIFSTAMPPAICCAILKVLELLRHNPKIGFGLIQKAQNFAEQIYSKSKSQIIPLFASPQKLQKIDKSFRESKVFAKLIYPPSVPHGRERIRLSICTWHTDEDIKTVLQILDSIN